MASRSRQIHSNPRGIGRRTKSGCVCQDPHANALNVRRRRAVSHSLWDLGARISVILVQSIYPSGVAVVELVEPAEPLTAVNGSLVGFVLL